MQRVFLALFLALTLAISVVAEAAVFFDVRKSAISQIRGDGEIMMVYAGASDCPPCWDWKRNHLPKWQAARASRYVISRHIELPSFNDMRWKKRWPAELEHVRTQILRRGAPQFVVLINRTIVLHGGGTETWRDGVVPFLRNAVLQKISTQLVARHGQAAPAVAATRAEQFSAAGHTNQAAMWRRIATRASKIQIGTKP